jgi:DNA polymerase-3 subunit epsilon
MHINTPIEEAAFLCVDTETTGLSPLDGGRICEIAALESRGGNRLGSFCTFLNPQTSISPEVTAIHGITDEMVSSSPSFADMAPRIIGLLQGRVLVFHNADFDISFLQSEFGKIGLKMPPAVILDTLKFARCHGNFTRNRLGVIANELGYGNENWHRAMADTVMTEKIFYYFLHKFKRSGARTVGDLCGFQTKNKAVTGELL